MKIKANDEKKIIHAFVPEMVSDKLHFEVMSCAQNTCNKNLDEIDRNPNLERET